NPAVPAGTLTVTVKPDAPQGPLTFRIDGKATVGGKPVVAIASHGLLLRQAMANLPYPPPEYETQMALAVRARPAFTLGAKLDAAQASPGQTVRATVTAARAPGFADEIALSVAGLPPTVTAPAVKIAKGQNEVKVPLAAAAAAAPARLNVTFTGKS